MSVLSAKHFHDEEAAYAFVEAHVWPQGRVCPHCGTVGESGALKGASTRVGVYKCYACRKPFTVKVGTIFESSHVKLHLWLQAIFLISSSKKGFSANQLHRTLGVTLKTAWFMAHRIREAMRSTDTEPMGGAGKIVEADETFIGHIAGAEVKPGGYHKYAVLSLVERGGKARSYNIGAFSAPKVREILEAQVSHDSTVMTDQAAWYKKNMPFARHESVNHSHYEWARGDVTTNTVESFFSVFKRGMKGTYQHCDEKHLQRYLAEFDFRYNHRTALGVDDVARASHALKGIIGKRLTYRTVS